MSPGESGASGVLVGWPSWCGLLMFFSLFPKWFSGWEEGGDGERALDPGIPGGTSLRGRVRGGKLLDCTWPGQHRHSAVQHCREFFHREWATRMSPGGQPWRSSVGPGHSPKSKTSMGFHIWSQGLVGWVAGATCLLDPQPFSCPQEQGCLRIQSEAAKD